MRTVHNQEVRMDKEEIKREQAEERKIKVSERKMQVREVKRKGGMGHLKWHKTNSSPIIAWGSIKWIKLIERWATKWREKEDFFNLQMGNSIFSFSKLNGFRPHFYYEIQETMSTIKCSLYSGFAPKQSMDIDPRPNHINRCLSVYISCIYFLFAIIDVRMDTILSLQTTIVSYGQQRLRPKASPWAGNDVNARVWLGLGDQVDKFGYD